MRAMHFICGRDDGLSLNNLVYEKATGVCRSGKWDISTDEARELIGGCLYLHPTKAKSSEFGGVVVDFDRVVDRTLGRPNRIVLIVRREPEGKEKCWRGDAHDRAHSSGLVLADLPHEAAGSKPG